MSTCRANHEALPMATVPCTCPTRPASYVAAQPPPREGAATPSWEGVVRVMETRARQSYGGEAMSVWLRMAEEGRARDAFGAEKYGHRHQHDNDRDHAADAYQEAQDACCYWFAEWKKTDGAEALGLFGQAVELAFQSRLYLYRRDGR